MDSLGHATKKLSDYMSAAEYVRTGAESSKYEYYGVRKGRSTGVYTSSAAARLQVEGYSNAEWQGFREMHQARDYVNYTHEVTGRVNKCSRIRTLFYIPTINIQQRFSPPQRVEKL